MGNFLGIGLTNLPGTPKIFKQVVLSSAAELDMPQKPGPTTTITCFNPWFVKGFEATKAKLAVMF